MEVKQEMQQLEKKMAELKLTKLYPDKLKSILNLDLENVYNLKVEAKYDVSTRENDEYYSNIDANLKVSYDYSKSNNSIFNIQLNVDYNRFTDYNCRYDGNIDCNSNVYINSESGNCFHWEYEKNVEIHVEDEEYKKYFKIINKIFEYIDYEECNWNNLIRDITRD